ncbi:MAG: RNB domain-containing ribonuclease [Treponema sp.]|jgi:exoribonuclease-2|nr:RNB domain-containing ribonuclease [Treponema sp.]
MREKSLVAYKNKPAVIVEINEKISITLGAEKLNVRERDVEVLHPGPCSLADIRLLKGDVRSAWELVEGGQIAFAELAELVYGEYSPASAWSLFNVLVDGLYFHGTVHSIQVRTSEDAAARERKRSNRQDAQAERNEFLKRLKEKKLLPQDSKFLQDVEALAYGRTEKSRTLRDICITETQENAHRLLLETEVWDSFVNPHPARFGCQLAPAQESVPPIPDEDRVDLTDLPAFAIDNAWSTDPDDAVSFDSNCLFVHVSDPAAAILPNSAVDRSARARGATLYLPEVVSRMLCEDSLSVFALGISEKSPALTFKMALNKDFSLASTEIFPSWVKVTRLTYESADSLAELEELFTFAENNLRRRTEAGAVNIDLPEVHVMVKERNITIEPLTAYTSANMVRECMLFAGEATAQWAIDRQLPFPFVAQEAGDFPREILSGMAGSYQIRRCMRPRSISTKPGFHFGLGLSAYTQVTSPLRRYGDLLAHEQIRAFLKGTDVIQEDELFARFVAGDASAVATVRAERASRAHWTAVYLADKKNSLWDGFMMEKRGNKSVIMIPSLGMETQVLLRRGLEPNEQVTLKLSSVKIPESEAVFTETTQ